MSGFHSRNPRGERNGGGLNGAQRDGLLVFGVSMTALVISLVALISCWTPQ